MKIERISENQIKCTLTREDLTSREIHLTELAYGSEKAKRLFQDMMQQAMNEVGFDCSNSPLMIEAVPISVDSILLIITKVDDPEELDSRFSRFSSEDHAQTGTLSAPAMDLTGVDDIVELISRIHEARKAARAARADKGDGAGEAAPAAEAVAEEEDPKEVFELSRFFLFRQLSLLIRAAHALDETYDGSSSLYKNPDDGNYYLILRKENTPPALFNKVCNVLTEYGLAVDYMPGIRELFDEHMTVLLRERALQKLRMI